MQWWIEMTYPIGTGQLTVHLVLPCSQFFYPELMYYDWEKIFDEYTTYNSSTDIGRKRYQTCRDGVSQGQTLNWK